MRIPTAPNSKPNPGRSQRGATLIEFALIFPLMVLVIVGILEIGLAFKDYLTVSYISREAARVGALAGDDTDADCSILRGIGTVATEGDLARITSVQIFKADVNGTQGVTNYAVYEGGDPDLCNVPAQPSDAWDITPINWAPTSRQTAVGDDDLDIIGVRIIMTHNWITNFPPFTGSMTIDESTITRLEPQVFE